MLVTANALADLLELSVVVDPTYDENCYVLHRRDTDRCLVVDPGLQHAALLQHLERHSLRCERILLTHGHGDHVSGVPAVRAAHRCPAAINPADRFLLPYANRLPGVPADLPAVECDEELTPGEVLHWQGVDLQVLATPGHTPGSVCLLLGEDLLAGDTLFRRSVGRTDLPGGDWDTLMASIQGTLYGLEPQTVVRPGHGAATSIAEEMRWNPFAVHPRYR
ncbi:MAG: MBL fold metallo-hydrolase [Candidatus Dormibacteria bacterium]